MTTTTDCVANLSEQELLDYFTNLVARDRRTTADLLVAIAEIDDRKLWATHACSSMFRFCMERFHMSEQVTAKRLWSARTARRFPVILEMVARGELHLGAIYLLAKHLSDENHLAVLERAKHKSSREVEQLVAELAPRADVPSQIRALPVRRGSDPAMDRPIRAAIEGCGSGSDRPAAAHEERTAIATDRRPSASPESLAARKPIVPLSPRRYRIEITVDEATHDKLRSLQDLLARSGTGRDPAEIIRRAIDALLVQTLTRKLGCTVRAQPARTEQPNRASREEQAPAEQPDLESREEQAPAEQPDLESRQEPARTEQPNRGRMASFASLPSTFDIVAARSGPRSRSIPAAVRREVWRRDSGRCCYADAHGRRCRETGSIEFHHRIPFAVGGPATAENIELRCAAHNQLQAELDFGRSFMDARRGRRRCEAAA